LSFLKIWATAILFLSRSGAPSKENVKWEDGKEYPLIKLEISNTNQVIAYFICIKSFKIFNNTF